MKCPNGRQNVDARARSKRLLPNVQWVDQGFQFHFITLNGAGQAPEPFVELFLCRATPQRVKNHHRPKFQTAKVSGLEKRPMGETKRSVWRLETRELVHRRRRRAKLGRWWVVIG